ncbi:MAG: type III pantothenate kinase [Ruminococcaceae bacterium]|nr:type III pantothenate kinase [Oscillospiraceae bacterium]
MIMAIDIGNTNIVLGAYEGEKLLMSARLATDPARTEHQYAVEMDAILRMNGLSAEHFTVAAISCVVPPLLSVIRKAVAMLLHCRVIAVGPGVKTGLNIRIDNPSILGSDLVCGAVAAIRKYGAPTIVIDLGTATKISAIDKNGSFIGCSIMPGIGVSLNALSSHTAQLPFIDIAQAGNVIGTNSVDSMRSGIIYGTAAMLDGMIERYRGVLGQDTPVVATGGFAEHIIPHCKDRILSDPHLILDGLLMICHKNS